MSRSNKLSDWGEPSVDDVLRWDGGGAVSSWQEPEIASRPAIPWEETELYRRWERRVKDGKANDFVMAVSASSHTGVSGTGKTTAATSIAEEFDIAQGYDAEKRGTANAKKFAYDILVNSPKGSAMVLEEAQGTPASTGLNKRRGMKKEVMAAINGILANRDNNYTIIIVVQQLNQLDSSLIPLLDAWLLIRYEPADPNGPLMTHHEVHGDDYRLKNDSLKTPAIEDLTWPELPAGNENYQIMEEKKQEAKRQDGHSSDQDEQNEVFKRDDIPKEVRDDIICEQYERTKATQGEIAEIWGLTQPHVQRITSD